MFPLILAIASATVITPGAVPVVADVHPNETVWINELRDTRPEPQPTTTIVTAPLARPAANPIPPEQIDTLIRRYFREEDWPWARRVTLCESGWDASAKNPHSTASGLWQHLSRFWEQRSTWALGYVGDIWDSEDSTAVAAWLFYEPNNGGPHHWVCK